MLVKLVFLFGFWSIGCRCCDDSSLEKCSNALQDSLEMLPIFKSHLLEQPVPDPLDVTTIGLMRTSKPVCGVFETYLYCIKDLTITDACNPTFVWIPDKSTTKATKAYNQIGEILCSAGSTVMSDIQLKIRPAVKPNSSPFKQDNNPNKSPTSTTGIANSFYKCSFDSDMCQIWKQSQSDDFDWSRKSGKAGIFTTIAWEQRNTKDFMTGPLCGYSGKGSYLLAKAYGQHLGQKARLSSTPFPTGTIKLSYMRCLYGTDVDSLKTYKKIGSNYDQVGPTITRQYNRSWVKESIEFDCQSECQVVFEATRGGGNSGDIAIDDISIEFIPKPLHPRRKPRVYSNFAEEWLCNLDKNNCSEYWSNDKSSEIAWTYVSGPTQTKATGPDVLDSNYYWLMEARNEISGKTARLQSAPISSATGELTFSYNMRGGDIGRLEVLKKTSEDKVTLWSKVGNQTDVQWKIATINFTCVGECRLMFEAQRGVFDHGDIAVDDIKIKLKHDLFSNFASNDHQDYCDFENSFCQWQVSGNTNIAWKLDTGMSAKTNTGPMADYTSGSGWYAVFRDSTDYKNQTTILTSHVIRAPFWRYVEFAYHYLYYENQDSNLQVYKKTVSTGKRELLWTIPRGEGIDKWRLVKLGVNSDKDYVIEIVATAGTRGYGDIAIDNTFIYITQHSLKKKVLDCTFTETFCEWSQKTDDDFDWQINTGRTPTSKTGPSDNDSYIYTDASFPRKYLDSAVIESPIIGPLGNQSLCLQFFYYMYGTHVGKLELTQVDVGTKSKTSVWEKSRNQGQQWWSVQKTVSMVNDQMFRFQLQSTRGLGIKGDIAIKNVSLTMKPCKDDAPYNCDFTDNICDWQLSPLENGWKIVNTSSKNRDFAPPTDHTTGANDSGYVVAVAPVTKATLNITITSNKPMCLAFWYFTYGSEHSGKLYVWTRSVAIFSMETIAWSHSRETVLWQHARVNIQSNLRYSVGISAKVTDGFMALDDIVITEGNC